MKWNWYVVSIDNTTMGRKDSSMLIIGKRKINFKWGNPGLLTKTICKKDMIKRISVTVAERPDCFYPPRIHQSP